MIRFFMGACSVILVVLVLNEAYKHGFEEGKKEAKKEKEGGENK